MITIIAALARNNVIGKQGKLPWVLPEDLKRFKALTTGHIVIMGRKTWESIPEKFRPLPGRTNVVISHQADYSVPPGVFMFSSIEDAFGAQIPCPQPTTHCTRFIIGGGEIYRQAIDRADALEITHVDQIIGGDVFFPKIDPAIWREVAREPHEGFYFVRYERTSHPH